jgi:uncharacterized phage-associated protein
MAYDVRRLANAILMRARAHKLCVTNMALNKLIYFSHAWHLALHDDPLVDSYFEAWQFGPVHPVIYRQFKHYVNSPILSFATRVDLSTGYEIEVDAALPFAASTHVDKIVSFYGPLSGARLSQISHESGAPWDVVWNGTGSRPGMKIPDDLTKSFYRQKLERQN